MSPWCHGTQSVIRWVIPLVLIIPVHLAEAAEYRNFKLPCLAPLLQQIDPEAPASLNLAFLNGPWHAPVARDDIGAVDFPITTSSKQAQLWFNQGISFIHGQSNREAERSFRQALLLDPLNPMILWGLAVANEQRPGRASLFAQNSLRRIANTTSPRERSWIRMLADFYDLEHDTTAKPAPGQQAATPDLLRYRKRIRDLENLVLAEPDDVEARAFLLRQLVLDYHRSGVQFTSHLAVDHLAAELTRMAPRHPAAHYRIFLWLRENPSQAYRHARSSALIAPGLADSWRFAAEGWRINGHPHEAIALLKCALRVHHREMRDQLLMPETVASLSSNYAALGETLIAMGRLREARELANSLLQLPRGLNSGGITTESSDLLLLGRRLLVQMEILSGAENVINLFHSSPKFIPSSSSHREVAQAHYWTGLALCSLGRPDEAKPLTQALSGMAQTHKDDPRIVTWWEGLRYFQTLSRGEKPAEYFSPPYLPANLHAAAWQKLGAPQFSLKVAQDNLKSHPRGLSATALYCSTNFNQGNHVAASRAFDRTFRQNVLRADEEARDFACLDETAQMLSLPRRWTLPPGKLDRHSLPDDPGQLGPDRWSPPSAPEWKLSNHAGSPVSLRDFEGKSVLLNFFLGVNCPFCLNQLDKFRPFLTEYRKAGIEMIAISSDDVGTLAQRLGKTEEKTAEAGRRFPFAILADPELKTFRNYKVFDHFEDGPMHGTFLIGPRGRILWSDINHQPFNHPAKLLQEARRLLSLHNAPGELP